MTSIFQISRTRHSQTRIIRLPDFAHAAGHHLSPIVITEIASAATDYPIVLIKDRDDGGFRLAALFGFAPGENFYHGPGGWNATYVPLNVTRYPFVIGIDDKNDGAPCLCIDEASGHVVNGPEGDCLFDAHGAETDLLAGARRQMRVLYDGETATQKFIAAITALDLVAPLDVKLQFADGATRKVTGLYGVDAVRLNELDDAALVRLNRDGHMLALHAAIISQHQFNRLAQLHNARSNIPITRISAAARIIG